MHWTLGEVTDLSVRERWIVVVSVALLVLTMKGFHVVRVERDQARLRVSIGEDLMVFLSRVSNHARWVPQQREYPIPWQHTATEIKLDYEALAEKAGRGYPRTAARLFAWRSAYIQDLGPFYGTTTCLMRAGRRNCFV